MKEKIKYFFYEAKTFILYELFMIRQDIKELLNKLMDVKGLTKHFLNFIKNFSMSAGKPKTMFLFLLSLFAFDYFFNGGTYASILILGVLFIHFYLEYSKGWHRDWNRKRLAEKFKKE